MKFETHIYFVLKIPPVYYSTGLHIVWGGFEKHRISGVKPMREEVGEITVFNYYISMIMEKMLMF